MTGREESKSARKRTPSDATDFERDQLRFLLSGSDVSSALATVNPSLAWLPVIQEMRVLKNENELIGWIERNFSDPDAVKDVVANLHFFGPEAASLIEARLNKHVDSLPTLLVTCWRLIIRHIRESKRGRLHNDWYEVEPQIRQGQYAPTLLKRIAEALRPKLKLGKRFSLRDEGVETSMHPSDLMSIDYEVDDSLSVDEVLRSWPETTSGQVDSELLINLTSSLEAALDDATEVGVESNEGYGTSDADVPSVADHPQNSYRSGFHTIVRVTAEIWLRLASKSPLLALEHVRLWRRSKYRLMRRLALFACAQRVVPPDFAADTLIGLPSGELFLTGSSVEAYQVIRRRWTEFDRERRQIILDRLSDGPPRNWFKEGAEIDRAIDRCRFDVLAEMERDGLVLNDRAVGVLGEIRVRWPNWLLRPPEQAGFHVWFESRSGVIGDASKLRDVADDQLITEARRVKAGAEFMDGDVWQALCVSEPDRAVRGLERAAAVGDWGVEFWRQLLWARREYANLQTGALIVQLLMQWPGEDFKEVAPAAASWLDEHAKTIDDSLLWPLWDKIADASLVDIGEAPDA